jgi:hypothetical protein
LIFDESETASAFTHSTTPKQIIWVLTFIVYFKEKKLMAGYLLHE